MIALVLRKLPQMPRQRHSQHWQHSYIFMYGVSFLINSNNRLWVYISLGLSIHNPGYEQNSSYVTLEESLSVAGDLSVRLFTER